MKSGKVWGSTKLIFSTPIIELHRIIIEPGFRCSKHKHLHKYNGFYVESGTVNIHVFKNDYALEDVTILTAGEQMVVKPGEYHYFETLEAFGQAIVYEAYWPELLGEDIVRQDHGCKLNG